MKISEVFAGSYFKAEDFDKKGRTLVIEGVAEEKVGDDTKVVISFTGEEKTLPLNKTNAIQIADLLGDDTDEWVGKGIVVYRDSTMYQGKRVACMRVGSGSRS